MDKFQSHEDILNFLFDKFKIKKVFEVGMGNFSTELFVNRAKKVVSMENANQMWFEEINKKYEGKSNFVGTLKLKYEEIYSYIDSLKKFDLCFIDGRAGDRWRVANHLINKSSIIVCHDSEASCYNYEKVIIPYGWRWIDITEREPWTAVLTNREDVYDQIHQNYQIESYETRTFFNKRYLIDNKNALTYDDLLVFEGKK